MLNDSTPVDELVEASKPGWPRAQLDSPSQPRPLPLPWINGVKPAFEDKGFIMLDALRVREAVEDRLCFCCGEPLRVVTLMGRHRASFTSGTRRVWLTDGPAGHPRCIALAAAYCPHLRSQHEGQLDFVIAFEWRRLELGYVETPPDVVGQGEPRFIVKAEARPVTLGQLREIAARDPLGEGDQAVIVPGTRA